MRVLLVALLLSVGACADKGYEALPNHDHIKCTGKCDVRLKSVWNPPKKNLLKKTFVRVDLFGEYVIILIWKKGKYGTTWII